MSIEKELHLRSESKCELCSVSEGLKTFEVTPKKGELLENCILICETCQSQIENPNQINLNHWRCLNDSMWSMVPAVQVMAWRMLNRLKSEGWSMDLLNMLYLEEEILEWAQAEDEIGSEEVIKHIDSNGSVLQSGDNVVLIKDLNVKGANFTAKRGTTVKGISLVDDNAEQIEGRVSGQQIVILTKYVKK